MTYQALTIIAQDICEEMEDVKAYLSVFASVFA